MGKAIVLKKKDGEKAYPISASDLIFDPVTKRTVKQDLENKQSAISDLDTIRQNANKGATAVQPSALNDYATKGELGGKQDSALKFQNMTASNWVSDSTYADFPYRCDIACSGVTSSMYAEVVFNLEQATSGKFAPLCETKSGVVSIWSSENASITVPTIIITK